MRWLLRALTRQPHIPDVPRPANPICVIGDIHGRIDLLDMMLEKLLAEPKYSAARIIILGDMVDRGPNSAEVLRRLYALQSSEPDRVICLMGNHERMMLDFITSPDTGARWLKAGGAQTVASFDLSPSDPPEALADGLITCIPQNIYRWLTQLPLSWMSDGLLAVHAAADPALPADAQPEQALLWGHRAFGRILRRDGLWVACGHVVVDQPSVQNGRISVDTGAWTTDVLTAGWFDQQGLRFIQVSNV